MRALLLEAVGSPMVLRELRDPVPGEGEVLVRVAACGVCHSDLHFAKGHLSFPLPCVPGHEVSGRVEACGPGVTGLVRGTRVVSSFITPCARCRSCERGRDDLCETYFATNRAKGVGLDGKPRLFRPDGTPVAMNMLGGMADYIVVPATDVFPLPEGVPLEESAIVGCAIMTAYGAIRHQAELQAGETVAVIGAGGVGSSLIAFARIFGAREIVAVDVREGALEGARALGATRTVDASKVDPVRAAEELGGVDVALEAIGRPETVVQAFQMTREGGRTVVVGVAPAKATAPIELTRLVRRGIRITGSYGCRVRTDLPEILRLAAEGRIDVAGAVTRRWPLAQAPEAYAALDRGEVLGRAIVVP
jgi:S-(hydroxymethyl)glutathione dehydrogenase/alcohol dehydrogenase